MRKFLRILLIGAIVILAFVAVYRIVMFTACKNRVDPVSATAESFSQSFLYPGSDVVQISYQAEGTVYSSAVMAPAGTIHEGDQLSVYYYPQYPFIATSAEDHSIRMKTIITLLIISAVLLIIYLLFGQKIGRRLADMQRPFSDFYSEGEDKELLDRFWDSFLRSLQYKISAWLKSALDERERGLEMVKDIPAYSCMAHHNLQILRFHHCADGVQGYQDGLLSLQYKNEYEKLSDQMRPKLGYSSYDESLVYTAMLAKSRDEAKPLLEEVVKRNAHRGAVKHAKEMLALMDKFPRWADIQKNYAANLASRNTAKTDKGDYAPACGLIQTVLSREGEKGYDLTEEEYVSLLDDYLMLSLKYFLLRADVLLKGSSGFVESELLFLLERPLQMLIDFLPDCGEERFKETFRGVMKEYALADDAFREYLPEYQQVRSLLGM